ncbi:MAG: glycosyltransferase [bacterium]|nr:glycosyltransferase [bacterium]
MRILLSFMGGSGHFLPLVSIAHAAQDTGHEVAFVSGGSMQPTVETMGFSVVNNAVERPEAQPPQRLSLQTVNVKREEDDLREKFARHAARSRAAEMLEVCARWMPDVIVCDEVDFGSMIAGEKLGIPYASVVVIASGSFIRLEVVGEALNEVRAGYHLPPDSELKMLSRDLVLTPVPRSFRDPAFPLPPTAHLIRPEMPEAQPSALSISFPEPDRPLVYFTLGTIFNLESGDLFTRVLEGLRDLPINVVMTVGPHIQPAEFGAQPDHIHIAQYIPQASILPHCAAVISHGGSGSVIAALAHGLPMVLLPMGADQPHNAARCEALGVARVLDVVAAAPTLIRDALKAVLSEPSYRAAAKGLRDEIAAMPHPSSAVPLLERLATDKSAFRSMRHTCQVYRT